MRFSSVMRRVTALVISAATMVSLAACGSGNDTNAITKNDTSTVEPQSGTPIDQDSYPMPATDKAYNNPKDRSELKQGGTLTQAITEIGPDWNMFSTNGNTVYMAALWAFYMPALYEYSVDGSTITPNKDYLTSVEETSEDPETITYTISDKATWNDGTPITWKDFYATWKVSNGEDDKLTPASTTGYDQIESVTRGESDKQAVVTFKTPYYPYQSAFSHLYPSMAYDENDMAKTESTYTDGWSNNPHSDDWGAGPFKVEKVSDSEVSFVPNDKWWGDKPLLDKVTFKQMEPSASINAFQNGELDITGVTDKDRLAQAKKVKDARLLRSYDTGVSTFTINAKSENTKDVNLRKAFVQAIDRSQLQKIDFEGLSWEEKVPGSVLLPQFQDGYEDNMPKDSAYSTENAKKTLEDAGYTMGDDGYYAKDGKTAEFTYTTFSDSTLTKAKAQAVQQMAKAAGIKINIDIKASNQFSDVLGSGSWDMIGLGWSASDPFNYASGPQLYGSTSDSNFGYIGDADTDALFAKVNTIEDQSEAIKQFNKAEKQYMSKYYTQIPFENGVIMFATKKGLANYGPAGYSCTLTMGTPLAHTEDIGWEK